MPLNLTAPSIVQPASTVANVIAIGSGKGGVGKTWFAVTLSHALARNGKNVLLFDGDLGLANVDIQLGLTPKHDLGAVIAGRRTLQGAAFRYDAGGFDIIAGQSGSGGLASLPPARLAGLRDDLMTMAPRYNFVIIDIGAGIERPVRTLLGRAGTCLVVTTDEPTSLTDAYALIKVIKAERANANLQVVVNMAASEAEGERIYGVLVRACESFLKFTPPLAGIVRRDTKVRDAIRSQTASLTRYPNSDAAADVEAIARRLHGMT